MKHSAKVAGNLSDSAKKPLNLAPTFEGFPNVTTSVYSRSPPIGKPRAMRVTEIPKGLINFDR